MPQTQLDSDVFGLYADPNFASESPEFKSDFLSQYFDQQVAPRLEQVGGVNLVDSRQRFVKAHTLGPDYDPEVASLYAERPDFATQKPEFREKFLGKLFDQKMRASGQYVEPGTLKDAREAYVARNLTDADRGDLYGVLSFAKDTLKALPRQVGTTLLQAGRQGWGFLDAHLHEGALSQTFEPYNKISADGSDYTDKSRAIKEGADNLRDLRYAGHPILGKGSYFSPTDAASSAGYGLASSVPAQVGGLVAGPPGAAIGAAAGAPVAFLSQRDEFLSNVLEKANAELQKTEQRRLTQEEADALVGKFSDAASRYGAWEAIPEMASNMIFGSVLGKVVHGFAGKTMLTRAAKTIGAEALDFAGEHASETASQWGQGKEEAAAGLREKAPTLLEAYKEQAPVTNALFVGTRGTGLALGKAANKLGILKTEPALAPGEHKDLLNDAPAAEPKPAAPAQDYYAEDALRSRYQEAHSAAFPTASELFQPEDSARSPLASADTQAGLGLGLVEKLAQPSVTRDLLTQPLAPTAGGIGLGLDLAPEVVQAPSRPFSAQELASTALERPELAQPAPLAQPVAVQKPPAQMQQDAVAPLQQAPAAGSQGTPVAQSGPVQQSLAQQQGSPASQAMRAEQDAIKASFAALPVPETILRADGRPFPTKQAAEAQAGVLRRKGRFATVMPNRAGGFVIEAREGLFEDSDTGYAVKQAVENRDAKTLWDYLRLDTNKNSRELFYRLTGTQPTKTQRDLRAAIDAWASAGEQAGQGEPTGGSALAPQGGQEAGTLKNVRSLHAMTERDYHRMVYDAAHERMSAGEPVRFGTMTSAFGVFPDTLRFNEKTGRVQFYRNKSERWLTLEHQPLDSLAVGLGLPSSFDHRKAVSEADAAGVEIPEAVRKEMGLDRVEEDQKLTPTQIEFGIAGALGVNEGEAMESLTRENLPGVLAQERENSPAYADEVEAYIYEKRPDLAQPPVAGAAAGVDIAPGPKTVASNVAEALAKGEKFTWRELQAWANEGFGGTQAEGRWNIKEAYDAMEMGVNQYLATRGLNPGEADAKAMKAMVKEIEDHVLALLPTQTKRTEEQLEFQQFSTPPHLAAVAAWVARPSAKDVVLEPSAGIGGLAMFAKNAGADVHVNELDPRRRALLSALGFSYVTGENAEQLHNILPEDVKPTLVIMNPPFSSTAGRMKGQRKTKNVTAHLDQALERLEPGGRLVAILSPGMGADKAHMAEWWRKTREENTLRANVYLDGEIYKKYGTSFDNLMVVIDKVPPHGNDYVNIECKNLNEAIEALTEVRDARANSAERVSPEPGGQEGLEAGRTAELAGEPVRTPTGALGAGDGGSEGQGPGVGGVRGDAALPAHAGARAEGDSRPGGGREPRGARGPQSRNEPGAAGGSDLGQSLHEPGGAEPGLHERGASEHDARPVEVEAVSHKVESQGEITEALFESYRPQRVRVKGAKPHPTPLVQSAAMAAVEPPAATYAPHLPRAAVESGALSDAQLEQVVYAGQAHADLLPDGSRRGYFIGDGTGVGKGREISGIILDNWNQGRKKAVWVTFNGSLFEDAGRDMRGIGDDSGKLFQLADTKLGEDVKRGDGVLFTTYATLPQLPKGAGKAGKEAFSGGRLDQIEKWLGKDFDGVLVFDESHKMGNAIEVEGARGKKPPAQQALAGVELQKRLPNARVVYVSATGATEPSNLSYLERMGLWGEGAPFANKRDLVNAIEAGGVAAMELVSRDLKAMGGYMARTLSYDGVTYSRLDHELTEYQRKAYDTYARSWQIVLENINDALEETGQDKNGQAKSAAMSLFWGNHQRFFGQVLTSMTMPSVLADIKAELAAGHSCVVQLTNTNEAAQERALQQASVSGEDLASLDITPRQMLMDYVRRAFPIHQFEQYLDEDGNERSRIVKDAGGSPVENRQAVKRRDGLLENLGALKVPGNPLDMIVEEIGPDMVAEVTGRSRRVILGKEERRGSAAGAKEAQDFMDGRRRVLVFSQAGGTGRSYHADRGAKNQEKRIHYILQPGWRADAATQGLGRTHRSNEAQPPHYKLVTTDLKGHKRFTSSIARRLDQLGALTQGQRQTGSQGLFSAADNLENTLANDAWVWLAESIYSGKVPGVDYKEFVSQTGLKLEKEDDTGLRFDPPPIKQFLNRLLSMTVDFQNQVFDAFESRLRDVYANAEAHGNLDTGMETLKAERIDVVREEVLHTDTRSGAETKALALKVHVLRDLMDHARLLREHGEPSEGWWRNKNSDRVYAAYSGGVKQNLDGEMEEKVLLRGVNAKSPNRVGMDMLHENYAAMDPKEAATAWDKAFAETEKTKEQERWLLTGMLLPVWKQISGKANVYRLQDSQGQRHLGRLLSRDEYNQTRKNMGLGVDLPNYSPKEALAAILKGRKLSLRGGYELEARRVSGEMRIEVTGEAVAWQMDQLKKFGAFSEIIQYRTRLFVPTGEKGVAFMERMLPTHPLVGDEQSYSRASADVHFSVRPEDGAPGQGMSANKVRGAVQDIQAKAKNARPLTVVQTFEDLPQRIKREARAQKVSVVEGSYDAHDGTVYMVADALTSRKRAVEVWMHEQCAHRGLRGLFGDDRRFGQFLRGVFESAGGKAAFREISDTYGFNLANQADQLRAAEEYLARLTEKVRLEEALTAPEARVWRKLVRFVKEMLRTLGVRVNFSDAEIEGVVRESVLWTFEGGQATTAGGVRFSIPSRGQSKALDSALDKIGAPRTGMHERVAALRDRLRAESEQGVFDRFASLRTVDEAAGVQRAEDSAYIAARMTTSLGDVMTAIVQHGAPIWRDGAVDVDGMHKGFASVFKPVEGEIDRWCAWMVGKRAEKLAAEGRENLFTPEEIKALKGLNAGRERDYDQAWRDYVRFKTKVLDFAEAAGVIDPAGRALWEHDEYIPFYRVTEQGEITGPRDKKGLANQTSGIKTLKGGTSNIGDPFENIVRNFTHLVDAAIKNHAMDLAMQNAVAAGAAFETGLKWEAVRLPAGAMQAALRKVFGDMESVWSMNDVQRASLQNVFHLARPTGSDIVHVLRGGRPVYYQVGDPLLLRALTAMNQAAWNNWGMRGMRFFKRLLTRGVTATPDFMLRNLTRDTLSAWAVDGSGSFKPVLGSLRGLVKTLRQDEDTVHMLAAGASFQGGHALGHDPAAAKIMVDRLMKRHGIAKNSVLDTPKKLASFMGKAWAWWEEKGGAVENSTRADIYAQMRRKGATHLEAAYEAKNIMDYSMRGDWPAIRFLCEVVPFFGARLTGLHRLGRGYMENPRAFLTKGGMVALASTLLYLANRDDEEFKALEDFDRDNYYHFFVDGGHYRLPKPFEVGAIFGTLPERIVEQFVDDKATGALFAERMAYMLTQTFNVGLPQVVAPFMEEWANKVAFTGRPIVSQRLARLRPGAQRDPWTSATASELAKGLDDSGLPLPEAVRSPKRLEHLVNAFFGTLGSYVLSAADMVTESLYDYPDRPTARASDMPLVRSFYRESPARHSKQDTEIYEMIREVQTLYATVKDLRRTGDKERAQEIIEGNREKLGLRRAASQVELRLAEFNKQARLIHADRVMSPEEKRERLDTLTQKRNEFVKRAYDKMRERMNR
ncbi:MAG: hypothetical protein FD177_881 [Desulfovibrionaceae bacterium]|nr:MAG: hypothetical protein FD177_881 [Desulfovibrionaceae bacterium]